MSQIIKSSSSQSTKIAILGGGIGGLSLALALHARGFRPTVFEQRPQARSIADGLFLTLAPNGVNALRALGLSDIVAAEGIVMAGLAIHNERGRRLIAVDYSTHATRFGAPSVTMRRGALQAILLDAANRAGLDLRQDMAIDRVAETGSGVTLHDAAGRGEAFDLLVAADGIWSRARRDIFPALPSPSYTGLVGTGGFVDMPDAPDTGGVMNMCFGHRAFFGFMKAAGGPLYWFGSHAASEAEARTQATPEAAAAHLRTLYSRDPLGIPDIVGRVTSLPSQYPIYDMPELSRWHTDRVCLLGDAAHAVAPHSGQGASMAMEDALVLAAAIESEEQPRAAFARFQALRQQRAGKAIKLGRFSGEQKRAQGWLALRFRDLVLPIVMPMGVRAQESLFAYRADRDPLAPPV
ncbi:MAG: FAD-dependent monooxygenase [Devosia sp.]|uniref:FAD-dependent monooxygenase n=1 Tax=Devosia sp. TaxID=1871048 RepID=UPI0024CB74ED|nr:NAD(P)/FAD-dependent oxidoreductase [Devosia sp.]UYN98156.1 MAG: FAD-dependent monooxygenase [Devosia sp.]